jgi:hypothetical protein
VTEPVQPPVTGTVQPPVTGTVQPPVTGTVQPRGGLWKRREAGFSWSISTRPVWSIVVLIIVGVFSFLRYPHSGLHDFYITAASVIAALYVAIALSVFNLKDSGSNDVAFEHGVYMLASSAGLLASVRGLSVGLVHDVWETRLLTGLAVAGMTAAVLLVADRLIAWQVAGKGRRTISWTVLYIVVAIFLTTFP